MTNEIKIKIKKRRTAAAIRPAIFIAFIIILLIFILSGCDSKSNQNSDNPNAEKAAESGENINSENSQDANQNAKPDQITPTPFTANPLTGLPMDEKYINRRPVAVMLNNIKKAQPQLGVSKADMIYEIPAEGGVTRLIALYQEIDKAGTLGSIRSARPYYLEVALGHDALLVHAGGSEEAYRDIQNWSVDNMDGVRGGSDEKIFWRDPDRRKSMGYEHSMLTSGENIQEYVDNHFRVFHESDYHWRQTYSDTANLAASDNLTRYGAIPAEKITVPYNGGYKTGVFEYDAKTNRYLANQYGKPHIDGITGEQIGAENLLILDTAMEVLDKEGRLKVRMTGTGTGVYCQSGYAIPIKWQKTDRNSPFVYTHENGDLLTLLPGQTYICMIDPSGAVIDIQPGLANQENQETNS